MYLLPPKISQNIQK